MSIKDIEVLIECKRLVEAMLRENKHLVLKLEANGKDTRSIVKQMCRMERALQGMSPVKYDEL